MKHGDLSNQSPKRLLVALSYVMLPPEESLLNGFRRWRRDIAGRYSLLPASISHLLRVSTRHGLLMELFAVGISAEELTAVMARLDAGQAHPFTHAQRYDSLPEFVATLPYRSEVLGVVDVPEHGLLYGHWFMSTTGL